MKPRPHRNFTLRILMILLATSAAALALWLLPAQQTATAAGQPGQPIHYIVFNRDPDGAVTLLFSTQVIGTAATQSLSKDQIQSRLAQVSRDHHALMVSLQDASGKPVFQTLVEVPRWLRGEFHSQGPEGELNAVIDGHIFPLDSSAFVVRVPVIAGTGLVIWDAPTGIETRFNLLELAATTLDIQFNSPTTTAIPQSLSGDPANRVDLLIMGDGYTAVEESKFLSDATNSAANFLGVSPLLEYANYVNIHTLFTASSESGADHPPYVEGCDPYNYACCGDPLMLDDELAGQMVETAFDSTFCTMNLHRLLTVDPSKVYAAAAAVPDWDQILVLVNDSTYGGAGGALAVTSIHEAGVLIAQHEYGHSFVNLADEYDSPYPGFPGCSDLSGSAPCEVNVTDQTDPELIKWAPWIEPTTPIPTDGTNPDYNDAVGLFEGARYQESGMYRPGNLCVMRALGAPWCQVPSQAYVLRLYQGGWGTPYDGISMIEPGTTSPAQTGVSLVYPESITLQAVILEPVGGPPAQVSWYINGTLIEGQTDTSFEYTPTLAQVGTVTIELRVTDTTPLVHPAMDEGLLDHSYTWNLEVFPPESTIHLPVFLQ